MTIVGSGLAAPATVQTADELAPILNRNADWVVSQTGVRRRHVAGPALELADLAAQAARQALGGAGPPDLIINASASARQLIPDTSVFIQRALGYDGIPSFTVHATCMSFLVALHLANALLNIRAHRRVLICSAEIATRGRNFAEPESAALLGDGAGAAVVEWCDGPSGMLRFAMNTWPEGAELTEVRGGGLIRHPSDPSTRPEDNLFHMDGVGVYSLTRPRFDAFLREFFRAAGLSLGDVRRVVPHQASGPALKVLHRVGFSQDQVVNIIAEYGNCVAAGMPMALATAVSDGLISPGDLVLFLGTGAGVSVGAALVRWYTQTS
jgi:3-oxoacyl-[acyl-carrier-protein] synthase-3